MSEASLRYLHGGVPGLKPGDTITPSPPHVIDGCKVCEARANGQIATAGGAAIDPPTGSPDRVYITTGQRRSLLRPWFHPDMARAR
ncbi:hypothetical protein [Streptomyces sp. NPDC091217]|uniref:hypothetical protein n=1 Tax=Streptomyces sp. NPDC091217 TaxID=3365975 RepID=UPI003804A6D0